MIREKFGTAFRGLIAGLRHRSIRVQYVLGALAAAAGIILKLTSGEWIAVFLCIGLVIATEYMNTAVEFLCNYLTEENDSRIGLIKDIAAGGVLFASLSALAAAAVILFRHIRGI